MQEEGIQKVATCLENGSLQIQTLKLPVFCLEDILACRLERTHVS